MAITIAHLGSDGPMSINELYVRRGRPHAKPCRAAHRTTLPQLLFLGLGASRAIRPDLERCDAGRRGALGLLGSPAGRAEKRVVPFAPFIEGMALRQLELVVAPPVEPTPLQSLGEHGGIYEFLFL